MPGLVHTHAEEGCWGQGSGSRSEGPWAVEVSRRADDTGAHVHSSGRVQAGLQIKALLHVFNRRAGAEHHQWASWCSMVAQNEAGMRYSSTLQVNAAELCNELPEILDRGREVKLHGRNVNVRSTPGVTQITKGTEQVMRL